ncbi:DUF4115 domain-containing protein [Burkholderiaceae bacterium DAT-1]|nr:DUF4115 domain-containing protein [Burkholderiaceae bacterium DAT-1]
MTVMNQSEQELNEGVLASAVETSSAGAVLSEQRKIAGLSVADVASKLKLSARQIEALEANRYDQLPGNTFVRGFVRNYARILEVDAMPLLEYLDSHLPKEVPQSALPRLADQHLPVLRPDGGKGGVGGRFIAAGVMLGALAAGGFYVYQRGLEPKLIMAETETPAPPALVQPVQQADLVKSDVPQMDAAATAQQAGGTTDGAAPLAADAAQSTAPAVTGTTPVDVKDAPKAGANSAPVVADSTRQEAGRPVAGALPKSEPKPDTKPVVENKPAEIKVATADAKKVSDQSPADAKGDIRLVAHEEAWVQITDATGKRLLNELVPAGTTRIVGGVAPYKARIGNAGQTELYYKGKPTDLTSRTKVNVANLDLP